jgi:hypothetical protein
MLQTGTSDPYQGATIVATAGEERPVSTPQGWPAKPEPRMTIHFPPACYQVTRLNNAMGGNKNSEVWPHEVKVRTRATGERSVEKES